MRLTLSMPEQTELKPRITVFGVGGAGGNAVNNMIEKALEGVEFVSANTDAQALAQSRATARVQLGARATEGLGAGARPEVGAAAAEETIEEIVEHLAGAHMCFITAGMGGGTGTGAAPIIAQAARELGVLTVGVVTKPFQFEGSKRMRLAEQGVEALQKVVDTLIIIPNQNLFRLANEKTTFTEAFALADDVLYQGVKGVTDLMVRPGLINLDFADVRSVMDEMGKAMMGTGEADGPDRAVKAAEKAIANPLLDEISLEGARGVLINVTGGEDMTLFELDEAANLIRDKVDQDANIIVGSTLDPEMNGRMRVSVVATGIEAEARLEARPLPRRNTAWPEPVAEPEPVALAEPAVEAEPEPEEVLAAMERASENERSLFSDLDERAPAMAQQDAPGDSIFDDVAAEDDLPQPAYRPAPRAPESRRAAPAPAARVLPDVEAPAEGFVAPKPRPAGTPSPETLQRLQAAIAKTPASGAGQQRRAAAEPVQQRPALAAEGGRKRFGINSLIDRMTGQGAEAGQAAAAPRREPRVGQETPHDSVRGGGQDAAHDPEQERIDIPAFLRRQAN